MEIVDSQIHANVLGPPEIWLKIMDALGISAALIDEFIGPGPDRELLPDYKLADGTSRPIGPNAEAAALRYPERLKYLMRVNPFDPELERWIEALAVSPNLRALRVVVADDVVGAAFEDGRLDRLFRLAVKHNLPVFVACPGRVKQLAPYARRFPDLKLIIDHCGVRFDGPRGHASIDDALTLAECPNIALKWGYVAVFLTTESYPFPSLDTHLKRFVDAYGPERVMWAGNYTATCHRSNWGESLFHIRNSPALSEADREWVLGRTCRAWLSWPAPKKLPAPTVNMHTARAPET